MKASPFSNSNKGLTLITLKIKFDLVVLTLVTSSALDAKVAVISDCGIFFLSCAPDRKKSEVVFAFNFKLTANWSILFPPFNSLSHRLTSFSDFSRFFFDINCSLTSDFTVSKGFNVSGIILLTRNIK